MFDYSNNGGWYGPHCYEKMTTLIVRAIAQHRRGRELSDPAALHPGFQSGGGGGRGLDNKSVVITTDLISVAATKGAARNFTASVYIIHRVGNESLRE